MGRSHRGWRQETNLHIITRDKARNGEILRQERMVQKERGCRKVLEWVRPTGMGTAPTGPGAGEPQPELPVWGSRGLQSSWGCGWWQRICLQ